MRVNIDGSNPRMIVIGAGDALEPAGPTGLSWSPDGQRVALDGLLTVNLGNNTYTAQRQLFTYRTDGSDLFNNADPTRQITHETDPWGPAFPQFSPDGSQLLYMEFVNDAGTGGNFTYLIGLDGTNRHEVPTSYGAFIPTATPGAPPALVDMTHIKVPSVHSLNLANATSKLEADNLTVGALTYHYSATASRNSVVSQAPSAGAVAHRTMKLGPSVNLVISRGPAPPCLVPKLSGKRLKAAARAVAAGHCRLGKVNRAFSAKVRKGVVISQSRPPGKTLHPGAKVALTVSKGMKP
jgi:hypothetical protein